MSDGQQSSKSSSIRIVAEIVAVTLILFAAVILVMQAYGVIQNYREDEDALRESEAIRDMARLPILNLRDETPPGTTPAAVSDYPAAKPLGYDYINWAALTAVNANTIGWITLSDSEIDYPVVQGHDNAHYLYHTFAGLQNVSGAIFMDYRDTPDFSGSLRIYGHNMRNGTKFGSLSAWAGEAITILYPGGKLHYTAVWRGTLTLQELLWIDGDLALITCVRGHPEIRYVVLAERIGDD